MKINIKDIPEGGLNLSRHIEPAEIGLSDDEIVQGSLLDVSSKIEKAYDTIIAKTKVRGKFTFHCARCLEPVNAERSQEFLLDYKVEDYKDSIDMGEDIRQEVILGFPSRVLCKPDCKGLCRECGVNLNREKCRCYDGRGTKDERRK